MFKIKEIKLLENRTVKTESCEAVNLIIGGNNSGKTTLLNDIYAELKMLHAQPPDSKWTYGMKLVMNDASKTVEKVFPGIFERDKFFNFDETSGNLFILKDENRNDLPPWNPDTFELLKLTKTRNFEFDVEHVPNDKDPQVRTLFTFLVRVMVGNEPCTERLNISFKTDIRDIRREPQNDFVFYLYKNRKVFELIKKNFEEVYGYTIDFDNIPQGSKPLRIIQKQVNKRLTDHYALSREWNSKTKLLDSVGHGIRAYLKLVFALIHPTHQIIFIDEPETFIHPPQRRALGQFIADLAERENKQLFIATHDSEFIRGIILGSKKTKVKTIRLFQENGSYYSTSINNLEIASLQNSKTSNLLNERIINSLFYDKTILCESENDRIIYEEASAQYHWSKFHNTNFVGFNGLTDAMKFYNKLKEIKIKLAVIVDIDFLRTGTFPETIDDAALKDQFNKMKTTLMTLCPKNSQEYLDLKAKGLKVLVRKKFKPEAANIKDLVKKLKAYGVHVAPAGELESWTQTKDLNKALEKIRTKKLRSLSDFLGGIISK